MKLEMLNGSLQSVAEYLPKLKLNGRPSRARQKLLAKVADKFKEFYSDIQEVKSEHPDDTEKQNEAFAELSKEKSILDMSEYAHMMPTLYQAMLDYPHEIDTQREYGKPTDASIHDYIIDVLEEVIESNDVPTDNENTELVEAE